MKLIRWIENWKWNDLIKILRKKNESENVIEIPVEIAIIIMWVTHIQVKQKRFFLLRLFVHNAVCKSQAIWTSGPRNTSDWWKEKKIIHKLKSHICFPFVSYIRSHSKSILFYRIFQDYLTEPFDRNLNRNNNNKKIYNFSFHFAPIIYNMNNKNHLFI